MKHIKKFEDMNEGIESLWSNSNKKAISSWGKEEPDTEYIITTNTPIKISTLDKEELAKIKLLFYKHDVKFSIKELSLKDN